MKRLKFYPILFLTAIIVFGGVNIFFISKVDPYEFGRFVVALATFVIILVLVIISSLVYEITHPIKKDTSIPGTDANDEYEKTFKLFKVVSFIILLIATVTSFIYIWPSIIHHYFFVSLYILTRFILIIFSGWVLYLSIKKKGYVRFVGWFMLVIIIFMYFWGVGLISFKSNDTQGDIYYNRDHINKKLDSIKQASALNTDDVNICFGQKDSDSQANCVISLAEKLGDINLCNEVTKISYKRGEGAHISNKPLYYESQCYLAVAKKTNNYDLCNKMIIEANVSSFYTQCLTYFAVQKGDPSICDLYSDYYKNNSNDYDLTNFNDVNHIKGMTQSCKEQVSRGKLW